MDFKVIDIGMGFIFIICELFSGAAPIEEEKKKLKATSRIVHPNPRITETLKRFKHTITLNNPNFSNYYARQTIAPI